MDIECSTGKLKVLQCPDSGVLRVKAAVFNLSQESTNIRISCNDCSKYGSAIPKLDLVNCSFQEIVPGTYFVLRKISSNCIMPITILYNINKTCLYVENIYKIEFGL